jgi:ABC-type uncharacterized transport system auxiliary subunit
MRPKMPDDLNTDHIAVLLRGMEVRQLAGAKWTEALPALLQRAMVEALEASGRFAAVGDEESGLRARLRLGVTVKRFYLRTDEHGGHTADIALSLRLVDDVGGRSLGTLVLGNRQDCLESSLRAQVDAFDAALGQTLAQATSWVVDLVQNRLSAP